MRELKYIAVVDDHTMFRQGLIHLISFFPEYKVLFDAGNGKEFIDRLKPGSPPDIVLLDIAMPEMDGYETVHWIHVNYPDIKVLALSSMDGELSIIRMIKLGPAATCLKMRAPKNSKQDCANWWIKDTIIMIW